MECVLTLCVIALISTINGMPDISTDPVAKGEIGLAEQHTTNTTTFNACIDSSDCSKLGDKYKCFEFLCYPWEDDSNIEENSKIQKCQKSTDCEQSKICYKNTESKREPKGLCFDKMQECGLNLGKTCPEGDGCCGGVCCKKEFHDQYKQLPCLSDDGCKDVSLGNFCCPSNEGQSNICCDTDPNAPTTVLPSIRQFRNAPTNAAVSVIASAFTSLLITVVFTFLTF